MDGDERWVVKVNNRHHVASDEIFEDRMLKREADSREDEAGKGNRASKDKGERVDDEDEDEDEDEEEEG